MFGDPILCTEISNDNKELNKVAQTFCWVHSTFSLDAAWKKPIGKGGVPYPGVDKYVEGNNKQTFHVYYQWVVFVLFFQALFFYIPRSIWKQYEGGRVKALTEGMKSLDIRDSNRDKRALVVKYVKESRPLHNSMFFTYAVLEVLNFLIVIIQIIIMDQFLRKTFITYG